jgi:hypothetical protein
MDSITDEHGIEVQWRYYKDGKKLIPFVVDILSFERLADFLEIVVYNKELK